MTTTRRRQHRLARIALVTAIAIFSTGGCLSYSGGSDSSGSSYSGSANHSLDDQLIAAARNGDAALVEDLLNRGADIEARTDNGFNALMAASREGHDEVAAVLRAWAAEPGGRQDTSPTLVQSQESASVAQAPRPAEPKGGQGASLAEAKAQEALGRLDAELALRDQKPAPAAQAPSPSTPPPPPVEPNKTALLIANASYDHFRPLTTPLQEARQLGAALKRIGFEVQLLTDGGYDEMLDALHRFEERVRERGGTALFHYGGHGVQVKGVNYLLPVDREIPDERRVRSRAIPVDEISGALQAARSTANIVILDACRDNPLPRETRSTDVRGLAPVNDPPPNTLIVFAADGGQVAKHGLFTPALLRYIEQPGIEITAMLRRVRRDVYEASDRKQKPTNYDQLFTEVYLAGGAR